MGNSAGVFGVLAALIRPGLVVPQVIVPDISHLDWRKIKEAGVAHIIFDKDNCITKSLQDSIIPELQNSWEDCINTNFTTILIVSNSAGSSDDPLGVGADYLSKQLGQLVLAHPSKKPANACAKQVIDILTIRQQQQSPPSPGHILVIGDRITTDVILASRMQRILLKRGSSMQAVGVLTTRVHSPERLTTRALRGLETWVLSRLIKMGITPGISWRSKRDTKALPMDWQSIVTGISLTSTSANISEIADEEVRMPPPAPLKQRLGALPSRLSGALFLAVSRSLAWLGDGWHLINDGIRLGTKGYIGSPDPGLRRVRLNAERSRRVQSTFSALTISSNPQPTSKTIQFPSIRRFSTQRPPPLPPRPRLQGWPGAISALILLPTCWYGGILLHEWMDRPAFTEEEAKQPFNKIKDPPTFQQAKSNAGPPSIASGPQQEQTLLSAQFHLKRELDDIDEKLRRIESRSQLKQTKA